MSNTAGRLYVVATPIGNRDDITLRAIEVLRGCDRIIAEDTRHSGHLLDHLGIHKPMIALHEHNEDQAAQRVIGHLEGGEALALISDAGTPTISDPGFPLIRMCRERGIAVIPIPGASALLAALSVSGLPTDRFRFEGFLPRRRQARQTFLVTLRHEPATLIFYESSHRIVETLHDLVEVFGGDRQAVLARELTKLHETVRSATLAGLLAWVEADEDQRRGEIVLLLAGARPTVRVQLPEVDELLRILLGELPVRQAAALAARITGEKRNRLYQRALALVAD